MALENFPFQPGRQLRPEFSPEVKLCPSYGLNKRKRRTQTSARGVIGSSVLEKDKLIVERYLLRAEQDQTRKLQESTANCDQLKSELQQLQKKEQKTKTPAKPLMTKSRPDS